MSTSSYYKRTRPELRKYIREPAGKVLDVGCGEGVLGAELKRHGSAIEVVGVDISPDAVASARLVLDRALCCNIETADLSEYGLKQGYFDHVVCGDVLEHLRHPEGALLKLVQLLKDDGRIIISLPNVRHWSVLFPLLFSGEWKYQPEGILDSTHLRFFTKRSAMRLIAGAGLSVQNCMPLTYRKIDRIGKSLSMGMLSGFMAYQWLFVAEKTHHAAEL